MSRNNDKLANCSSEMAIVIDKCINEPEFRWSLMNDHFRILLDYGVDEKEVESFILLMNELDSFIIDRFTSNNSDNGIKFKKRNSSLDYCEALKYKKRRETT